MVRPGFVVSVHGEAPNFEIHKCEGKMDSSQRERDRYRRGRRRISGRGLARIPMAFQTTRRIRFLGDSQEFPYFVNLPMGGGGVKGTST